MPPSAGLAPAESAARAWAAATSQTAVAERKDTKACKIRSMRFMAKFTSVWIAFYCNSTSWNRTPSLTTGNSARKSPAALEF